MAVVFSVTSAALSMALLRLALVYKWHATMWAAFVIAGFSTGVPVLLYLDPDSKTYSEWGHRVGCAIWIMLAAIVLEHALQEYSMVGAGLEQQVRVCTCLTLSAVYLVGCLSVHAERLTSPAALRSTYVAFAVVILVANLVLMMWCDGASPFPRGFADRDTFANIFLIPAFFLLEAVVYTPQNRAAMRVLLQGALASRHEPDAGRCVQAPGSE